MDLELGLRKGHVRHHEPGVQPTWRYQLLLQRLERQNLSFLLLGDDAAAFPRRDAGDCSGGRDVAFAVLDFVPTRSSEVRACTSSEHTVSMDAGGFGVRLLQTLDTTTLLRWRPWDPIKGTLPEASRVTKMPAGLALRTHINRKVNFGSFEDDLMRIGPTPFNEPEGLDSDFQTSETQPRTSENSTSPFSSNDSRGWPSGVMYLKLDAQEGGGWHSAQVSGEHNIIVIATGYIISLVVSSQAVT